MERVEYKLIKGKKMVVEYDQENTCVVTRELMEMLIGLYQQGKEDAIEEFEEFYKNDCCPLSSPEDMGDCKEACIPCLTKRYIESIQNDK